MSVVEFHGSQRSFEMDFKGIDTVEDAVVKGLLAQVVPEVFDGVEFRCVGREFEQAEVVGQSERLALMPAGAVEHHQDTVLWMARGDFVQKELHAVAVDVGEDQCVQIAIGDRHGGVRIGVLLRYLGLAERTHRLGTPTAAGIGDPTEAGLILKHQPERPLARPRLVDFAEDVLEFFFQSSCAATSACGCRLSGASLRQP